MRQDNEMLPALVSRACMNNDDNVTTIQPQHDRWKYHPTCSEYKYNHSQLEAGLIKGSKGCGSFMPRDDDADLA
jgi:hypothetical protein